MMSVPLWSELEAAARAQELCEIFRQHPDELSPDEQALAMTLLKALGLLGRRLRLRADHPVS